MVRSRSLILFAGLMAALPAPAEAETYPDRPIQLVVPAGASSSTDTMMRSLAQVASPFGGAITLMFAAEQAERVRTLSVIAPAVSANEWLRNSYAVGYPSQVDAIRALGVEGWVRKSNTLARFPADFDPAFMDWYAREVGKADVQVVTAMVDVAGSVNARPYLEKIKAPVHAFYPTGSNNSTAEQEQALRDHIASVRVVRLNCRHALLGMLEPAACAGQILNFAAMHDGIVCRE